VIVEAAGLSYDAVMTPSSMHDERQRLARELHDGVSQTIALLLLRLDLLRHHPDVTPAVDRALVELRDCMNEASAEVRDLSRRLLTDTSILT
jgi:signal transduction histidine kinase